jgi:hypothetical protein
MAEKGAVRVSQVSRQGTAPSVTQLQRERMFFLCGPHPPFSKARGWGGHAPAPCPASSPPPFQPPHAPEGRVTTPTAPSCIPNVLPPATVHVVFLEWEARVPPILSARTPPLLSGGGPRESTWHPPFQLPAPYSKSETEYHPITVFGLPFQPLSADPFSATWGDMREAHMKCKRAICLLPTPLKGALAEILSYVTDPACPH